MKSYKMKTVHYKKAIMALVLAIVLLPGAVFASTGNELPEDDLGGGTEYSNTGAEKKENPLELKISNKTYKKSSLKKAKSFQIGASGKGEITYTRNSKAKKAKIKVNSKGKVTIPKKCKKGTYKIIVKAAGNKKYFSATRNVTIKIK